MADRRTPQETEQLGEALYAIAYQLRPLTIRSLFYRAVSSGIIEKTEQAYKTVCRITGNMRKRGQLPFEWLVDAGRFVRRPSVWDNPKDVLESARDGYRRNLWENQATHVEIWTEKDAVVGVIEPVTRKWQVPLYSCRGYASLTLINEACRDWPSGVEEIAIFYFGDRDPSGRDIPRFIEQTLFDLAGCEFEFHLAAVTDAQVSEYNLPTRPTKQSDSRARNFQGESVELDAFDPQDLRSMVEDCIWGEIDSEAWENSEEQERADKNQLEEIIKKLDLKDEDDE